MVENNRQLPILSYFVVQFDPTPDRLGRAMEVQFVLDENFTRIVKVFTHRSYQWRYGTRYDPASSPPKW